MLHGWGRQLRFIRKVTAWSLSIVAFWAIRILFTPVQKVLVSVSWIVILKVLPILFSVLLRHCSIIARFIVKPIRTSRQLPLRKTLKWDMFLRTVSWLPHRTLIRFIWGVRGVPMQLQCSLTARWGKHICPAGWDNWRNPENEKNSPVMLNMVIRGEGGW